MDNYDPDMQSLVNKRGRKRKEKEVFIKVSEEEQKLRLENQKYNLEA
jgi:hypothetical protein